MALVFHRTGRCDALGYPVFLLGWSDDLVQWSAETSPEVATLLNVMAANRCWVDLTALAPEGAPPTAARDAVQKRLARMVRSLGAVEPELETALAFQTRISGGRVFGRIKDAAPRVETGVVSASFPRRRISCGLPVAG